MWWKEGTRFKVRRTFGHLKALPCRMSVTSGMPVSRSESGNARDSSHPDQKRHKQERGRANLEAYHDLKVRGWKAQQHELASKHDLDYWNAVPPDQLRPGHGCPSVCEEE